MGWFWASESATPNRITTPASSPSPPSIQPRCPVDHSAMSSCPVNHGSLQALNPRNNMPNLPNAPTHTAADGAALPTSREMSSIPMNSQGEVWQYPSPQQMLNAMSRKGYDGTNPEDVPAMVAVHNWLNEGSWEEILKWEKDYFGYHHFEKCIDCRDNEQPILVKFSGRPQRPTPKSWFLYKTGRTPKAFDHHEWFVSTPDGRTRRYVIDYYGVDELTFSVDVRPAFDDLSSLKARAKKFAEDMRDKLSGNGKKD